MKRDFVIPAIIVLLAMLGGCGIMQCAKATVPAGSPVAGPYACDGSDTTFTFTFGIEDDDALLVYLVDEDGEQTLLTKTTHYAITGANANDPQDLTQGGTVTTVETYSSDYAILLVRNTELSSTLDIDDEDVEDAIDKLTRIVQELAEKASRAIHVQAYDAGVDTEIEPAGNAGYLYRQSDGDFVTAEPIELGDADATSYWQAIVAEPNLQRSMETQGFGQFLIDRRLDGSNIEFKEALHLAVVNVRDYGATGDGVTDDTAAIQAAITARAGRVVFLPAGEYRITAPLTFSGTLILMGASGNAAAMEVDSTFPTMVRCGELSDYVFTTTATTDRVAISGILFWGSSADRTDDGATRLAGASATWDGLLDTSGATTYAYNIWLDRVTVCYSTSTTPAINLSKAFWSELNRVRVTHWPEHIALYASNNSSATTLTAVKCYFTYCRQCVYARNVTTLVFRDCVFESSVVAAALFMQPTQFEACHFENLGYCIGGLGYTTGITPKGFGVWNAELPGGVTAAVTAAYSLVRFDFCRFQSRDAGVLNAWFQSIGRSYASAAASLAVWRECACHDYASADFFDSTYKYYAEWQWFGRLQSGHAATVWDLAYDDLRLLDGGRVRIPFTGETYAAYTATVRAGKFLYEGRSYNELTTRPVGQPTGGQNEIGDEVTFEVPEASGNTGYRCVVAGSPGQWIPFQAWGVVTHDYGAGAADWTMTVEEAANSYFYMTNASGPASAVFPTAQAGRIVSVTNLTGQTITVKVSGGAGATVAHNKRAIYTFSSTDTVELYEQP